MKSRDLFSIITGVAGIFILYAFNKVIVISAASFVAVNLFNMILVALPFALLFGRKEERVSPLYIAGLVLVFLAGVSIALRAKFYLFLGFSHVPPLILLLGGKEVTGKRFKLLVSFEAGLLLIPLILTWLIQARLIPMLALLGISAALCAVQTASFVLQFLGNCSGKTGGEG